MFFVIILTKSKKNLVISEKWIYNFDSTRALNNGIDKTVEYLVFYSNNSNRKPNFLAPISSHFREDIDFCYKANIVKPFGKINCVFPGILNINRWLCLCSLELEVNAADYSVARRSILPKSYKETRKRKVEKPIYPHDLIDPERREYITKIYDILNYLDAARDIGLFDDEELRDLQDAIDINHDDSDNN